MVDSAEIRTHAAAWRVAARESRDRARRVIGLGELRWDAPAAEVFRARVQERAAGLRHLADLEESVGAALDEVAAALDAADAMLADTGHGTARGQGRVPVERGSGGR